MASFLRFVKCSTGYDFSHEARVLPINSARPVYIRETGGAIFFMTR